MRDEESFGWANDVMLVTTLILGSLTFLTVGFAALWTYWDVLVNALLKATGG